MGSVNTVTEQLEKVCKGLECCVLRDPDDHQRCGECSYNHHEISNAPCANGLKADALALIRQQQERIRELEAAQTARLMTLEEVHEMAWDYCYLEEEVIKDNVLQKYCGKHRVKCITWPSIASCVLTFGDDGYGKRWRCWTQRPTNEQREAVKWE